MKVLKSTIITFIANMFIFSISILTTVLTSRLLGTEGKGILSVANNIISISIIILGLGISASNIFFVGREKKDTNKVLGINLLVAALSVIVLLIIFVVNYKYKLNVIFKGLNLNIIIVILLYIPFVILKTSLINILLGLQDILNYNMINVIDNILSFLLLVVFLFVFKNPFWIIISNIVSVLMILTLIFYILLVKNKFKVSYNKKLFKEMTSYGIKAQVGNAVQFLNYRLDIFIIQNLLPISQVGIYSNAVALGETMWKVSGTVSTIVLPMTTNSKNKIEMKDSINKITRITFLVIIIISMALLVVAKPIILFLLGKDFSDSVQALILLIPGISIFSVCNILSSYIAGVGKIEKNIIASSISCVVTVVLDLILIPIMGINGASIATSAAYIVATFITVKFYMEMTSSKFIDIILIQKQDVEEIKEKIHQMIIKKIKK